MQKQQEMSIEEIHAIVLESDRQYQEAKKLKESQRVEVYETVSEDVHEFNKIPTTFKSFNDLDPTSKKLLMFIEARSKENNGDTKVNDSTLQEFLKASRSTVQRRLANLRTLGFINTIKKNFRDYERLDRPKQTEFFSDRIIRCNRVVVQKRFRILEKLGWKCDFRPKWNPSGIVNRSTGRYIEREWLLNPGNSYTDLGNGTIHPKWEDVSDLFKMGIESPETYTFYHEMNNLRYANRPQGILVLGHQKFRNED